MNKKFTLLFALVLVVVMSMSIFLVACNPTDDTPGTGDMDLTGTYDVKVWVSEIEGVTTLTEAQIDAFEAANPGIVINATVEGLGEGDAATQIIADVESAPDVYCFAQDQLARLVQAGAIAEIGGAAKAEVEANNDGGSVKAGQVGDKQYAYPLTSDNGYFMYYDKSVLSEEDVKTLEGIIAVCEAQDKFFNFELQGSAWYTASFFFATGCVSEWSTNDEGEFDGVHDTWNSAAGMTALKGMQKLLKSSCYQSNSSAFDGAAAVVTGTWNSGAAADAYGDNLGAAKLPTFTVDGETYQLGSFTGNKLMGVKPQTDVKKAVVLQKLALWLSGEECQAQRFEEFGWGPSNKAVQASEAVQSDVSLAAFAAQAQYGTPQGNIHGDWWSIALTVVEAAKVATTDAELQAALDTYTEEIGFRADPNWVPPTPELPTPDPTTFEWGVVGTFNEWSTAGEVTMSEQEDGSYKSDKAIELAEGAKFKCRNTRDWSGSDVGGSNGDYVVETAGTYYVVLTFDADGNGTITLVPAEA